MIEKGFIIRNGIKYGIGAEDANSVTFNNAGLDLASTNMQAVTEELNNAKLSKPEEKIEVGEMFREEDVDYQVGDYVYLLKR